MPRQRTFPTQCPVCGSLSPVSLGCAPSLPRPTYCFRAPMRSPSSCTSDFPTCSGSPTAQDHSRTRVLRPVVCSLPPWGTASASRICKFRGSMAGLTVPLSTLRNLPRDKPRMTRGQDGSLLLSCIGLSPTITCQFVLAHSPFLLVLLLDSCRRLRVELRQQELKSIQRQGETHRAHMAGGFDQADADQPGK